MGSYLPTTAEQQKEMLEALGLQVVEELYQDVPAGLMLRRELTLPRGRSEMDTDRAMAALAAKNKVFSSIFRGAGAYRHYIPAIVESVASKERFLTAYTPYQAEISQGVLQSIYEYQSMICELTGMDVSNASVYDGATAAAEAVAMCREKKRARALLSAAAHPDVIATVRTYCWGADMEMELIPAADGVTDLDALEKMLDETTACVYLAQPNYYGVLEDCTRAGELAHDRGARLIMGINPIAAAILKSPESCGADIVVGEGQPLGMPLAFGGPYLGFMATRESLTRRLPGRIVGETSDNRGRRAFVLTLQAREQHIRREKAGSNICSNQALCAMTAAVYMAAMGAKGMRNAATLCISGAHYLAGKLADIGLPLRYEADYFHEFVSECPVDADVLLAHLEAHGVLGGLPLPDGGILWCVTEMNTREDIDRLVVLVKEVL